MAGLLGHTKFRARSVADVDMQSPPPIGLELEIVASSIDPLAPQRATSYCARRRLLAHTRKHSGRRPAPLSRPPSTALGDVSNYNVVYLF